MEDEAADAIAVRRFLAGAQTLDHTPSFEIVHKTTLEEALLVAGSGEIAAVLLDLHLPDSHGIDTVLRMRETAPHVPIIVLTGSDDQRLGVDAVREGAQDYLRKSDIATDALARAIGYAIERKRAAELQRRVDQSMLAAQKLESLGLLAGGIAHDFNNLLCGILGYASLALDKIPSDAPFRHDVEQIERAAQSASDLTRQLLAYSGKGRFVVEPINLTTLVEDMADLVNVSAQRQVQVQFDLEGKLPAVEADASQLRQVALNLITNAVEASPRNAVVMVSTAAARVDEDYQAALQLTQPIENGDYVVLQVSDQGAGMSQADQLRMFDPFYSTKRSGRGLGLAATLSIVKGHRGAIKVYSQEHEGTTIKVFIPATQKAPRRVQQRPTNLRWKGHGTVLVIDDMAEAREAARAMLEHFGLKVITADGGRAGVARYREQQEEIDAVLLDMTMPDMDGAAVFRELRQMAPALRVVLTSGYTEQDALGRFSAKGLAGFVAKPLQPDALGAALRKALGQD